ncbi:MAG: hypothetical protein EA361_18790 [Bacteroidetes bacterium]|nr:MAG: hypothetical protein EA361_18790 [Bacteroidota bacterium]
MENQNPYIEEPKILELEHHGKLHLNETRKWTMFLSILGLVFMGLMLLIPIIALFALGAASKLPFSAGYFTFFPVLLVLAIYFFPIYFLLQFSTLTRKAVAQNNSRLLTKALSFLKLHYQYLGILAIILLGIYLIVFLFVGAFAFL